MESNRYFKIFETQDAYELTAERYLISKKLLSKEQTVQYFLNEQQMSIFNEILKRQEEGYNLADALSNVSNQPINNVPYQLSLIGDKALEDIKLEISKDFQLHETKLITNDKQTNEYLIDHLKSELLTCKSFDIIVSFIRGSGLNMLINTLNILERKGIKGRILTTTYLNVTEPTALKILKSYKNIEVKIYMSDKLEDSFHTKGYVFHRDNDMSSVIVGSSNISKAALKTGEEWNIRTFQKGSDSVYDKIQERFNKLWSDKIHTTEITDAFICDYDNYLKNDNVRYPIRSSFNSIKRNSETSLKPNSMQKTALENLSKSIKQGHKRGLAIAATGTGKTYLSAFASEHLKPNRVLFIAHREELILAAMESFKNIYKDTDASEFKIYKGRQRKLSTYTFASVQTLVNDLERIDSTMFDFIVIDEFHHATANSYMKILNHFTPKFLLGLTATPERTDGGDVFELVNYNIVIDVRLKHALESELLTPFQYYGISDETIDLAKVIRQTEEDIVTILNSNKRVDFIVKKIEQYVTSGKRKAIGFCQNISHAEFMNTEFKNRGYHSIVLTSKNTSEERQTAVDALRDKNNPLEFIFTVDLFNEGIDIPAVNLVLFLRPTESAIVFTQQLGRGLRQTEGKEYLIVLDFVTNDRKSYLVPIALSGDNGFLNKGKMKQQVESNFNNISSNIHIELDYKTKKNILKSIDNHNFLEAANIKKEALEFLAHARIANKNNKHTLNIFDFYNFEQAPNLSILLKGTYKSIPEINKAINEMSRVDEQIINNQLYKEIINYVSKFFPVQRIVEYISFLLILTKQHITKSDIIEYIEKKFSITLNEIALNKLEINLKRLATIILNNQQIVSYDNKILHLNIQLDHYFIKYLKDYLEYGISAYLAEHPNELINEEVELILYNQYDKKDVGALVGYDKDITSWRDGVKQYKGNHYLFVNLEKDEKTTEEHLMYKDYFMSQEMFHWESQNKTSQSSKTGQAYINHEKDGHDIHLFVRRNVSEDSRVIPFYYLGKVDFVSASGNKPIAIEWRFQHEVPKYLIDELTYHL